MKTSVKKNSLLIPLCFTLIFAGCEAPPTAPTVTDDGLVKVNKSDADLVYLRPGANLGVYSKVLLLEPQISFRKNWQSDTNMDRRMNRVSDSDMQKMIATGKKLLNEEFTKELTKGGYTVVSEPGPDVLAVKAAIMNLDVYAPDPDNMSGVWGQTYTRGSGEATLFLELFDSVTAQLLVRAVDHKSNENDGFSWRIPRSQFANINDARSALGSWAEMLANGLNRAKTAKVP